MDMMVMFINLPQKLKGLILETNINLKLIQILHQEHMNGRKELIRVLHDISLQLLKYTNQESQIDQKNKVLNLMMVIWHNSDQV